MVDPQKEWIYTSKEGINQGEGWAKHYLPVTLDMQYGLYPTRPHKEGVSSHTTRVWQTMVCTPKVAHLGTPPFSEASGAFPSACVSMSR